MTDPMTPDDRDLLAAEYAIGLIEGGERDAAQRLEATDPAFAGAVMGWHERLAPLLDEVPPVPADPAVWRRIKAAVEPAAANDNRPLLQRRLRIWRGAAIGAGALAASLAGLIALQPAPEIKPTIVAARAPVLVATLASTSASTSLSVAFDRQQNSILVSPGRLSGRAERDFELWIIPAGGQPVSLGLVRATQAQRIPVRAEVLPHFQQRSQIALSVEPVGGSPTGSPTGPVVAAGELLLV